MTMRLFLPAALLLLGCRLHHRPVEPAPPRWPTRDSLFALDQSRGDSTTSRGGTAGALSLMDSGVIYLRAGLPVTYRRTAVRGLFESSRMSGSIWQPLGGEVSKDLRSGFTFGIAARDGGSSMAPRMERYLAFWQRRSASSPWRIVAYVEIGGATGPEIELSASELSPVERRTSKTEAATLNRLRLADSTFSDVADRLGLSYAFANTAASDGAVFSGTRLVVGPEAMKELFVTQHQGTSVTWRPTYVSVAGSGDLGFTVGEFISTGRGASGAAVQHFGKYLTVWRREAKGKWKLVMSGGNATPSRASE